MTKVICWDYDHTLGDFDKFQEKLGIYEAKPQPGLRYGIKNLLTQLSKEGHIHVITSVAVNEYISIGLQFTSLEGHFAKIFGKKYHKAYPHGKYYTPVLDYFNITREKAISDVLIVGDNESDKPLDISGVVFLHHYAGIVYDSAVLEKIIHKLGRDFKKGFDKIYSESAESKDIYTVDEGKRGFIEDISFDIGYGKGDHGVIIPTTTNIKAEKYRRNLEPVNF